jgi:hypothetical protein
MKQTKDWTKRIDWNQKDTDIAEKAGVCRWRIGQLRVEHTGISNKGVRFDPPPGFSPGPTMQGTADKYGVAVHVAAWWHKVYGVPKTSKGRPRKPIPQDFTPVLVSRPKINQLATAKKYGVAPGTVSVWLRQLRLTQA